MNLYELYKAVHDRLAKDKNGNALTPEMFNVALASVNDTLYEKELAGVKDEQAPIQYFRAEADLKANQLPANYRQYISILLNGKQGDVKTPKDYDSYTINVLRPLATERPVVAFYQNYVLPQSGAYHLTYYRLADTPYMDYCIDANGDVVYMPVDSVLTNGTLTLDGETLGTGLEHLTDGLNHNSQTVELDWRRDYHQNFVDALCEWGAFNLRDSFAEQISLQK